VQSQDLEPSGAPGNKSRRRGGTSEVNPQAQPRRVIDLDALDSEPEQVSVPCSLPPLAAPDSLPPFDDDYGGASQGDDGLAQELLASAETQPASPFGLASSLTLLEMDTQEHPSMLGESQTQMSPLLRGSLTLLEMDTQEPPSMAYVCKRGRGCY